MPAISRPDALIFDVMGTVVDDVGGLQQAARTVLSRRGDSEDAARALAAAIDDRLGRLMADVNAGRRPWSSHRRLCRLAVRDAAAQADLTPLDEAAEDELTGVTGRFAPWPDSAPGLARLRDRHLVVALTNADPEELARCSLAGGLAWHLALSTRPTQSYKPDPRAYQLAVTELDLAPASLLMVAAHAWDLRAASTAGFQTCYVLRPGVEPAQPGEFDLVVHDLLELAEQLDC